MHRLRSSRTSLGLALGMPMLGAAVVAIALCKPAIGAGSPAAVSGVVAPALPPARLADTGLYSDPASRTLAPDVLPYSPQYPLWTDGATKRRWIHLPPGTAIDASAPDDWRFPVGTRLWKEFSLGQRVETRYLEKLGEGDWLHAAYVWNSDESDALLAPERGVPGAAESSPGVPYDIPGRADCGTCHWRGDGVLGFSALQLSPDRDPLAPHAEAPDERSLDLAALVERGALRGLAPGLASVPPRIAASSPRERAVLGYLHGNCGHCHTNGGLLAPLGFDLHARLAVSGRRGGDGGEAAIDPAGVLATLVHRASRFRPSGAPQIDLRVDPGRPERSSLISRMATRQALAQMPPLGTRVVDTEALLLVEEWIREDLAASSTPNHETDSHRDP